MRLNFFFLLLFCTQIICGQCKSITRFRADHPENTNMFFYSSTLSMLNTENNPDLAGLLKDIEEIRILNYDRQKQHLSKEEITALKKAVASEEYNSLMSMNDKGNSISLFSREKRGKTVGFVAVVENPESLTLIDLIGCIDVQKFMELKQKLDTRVGSGQE
jgi:hypothetical protein